MWSTSLRIILEYFCGGVTRNGYEGGSGYLFMLPLSKELISAQQAVKSVVDIEHSSFIQHSALLLRWAAFVKIVVKLH